MGDLIQKELFKEASGVFSKGYDKNDVDYYISKLTEDFKKALDDLTKDRLEKAEIIENLKKALAQERDKNLKLEEERQNVINAMVNADKETERIKSETKEEADLLIIEAKKECEILLSQTKQEGNKIIESAKAEASYLTSEVIKRATQKREEIESIVNSKNKELENINSELEKATIELCQVKESFDMMQDKVSTINIQKEELENMVETLREEQSKIKDYLNKIKTIIDIL